MKTIEKVSKEIANKKESYLRECLGIKIKVGTPNLKRANRKEDSSCLLGY